MTQSNKTSFERTQRNTVRRVSKRSDYDVDGDWELYDLAKDGTEQNNLASEQPAQAQKFAAMWRDWATRAKVKPDPNESKRKGKRKASKS